MLASVAAHAGEPERRLLLDAPLSGDSSKHGVTLDITWPAGSMVGNHTHPGDEYAVVLEGEIEITTVDGTKKYKTGEAYHNAKGVVHAARAVGDKPARTIATLVVEKGKPLSVPTP